MMILLNSNMQRPWPFNSLFPGGCGFDFKGIIFKCIAVIIFMSISNDVPFMSMVQAPTDDKSTLVQIMSWCHQGASHYLNQCSLRSMIPCGIIKPQWVKKNIACSCYSHAHKLVWLNAWLDKWFFRPGTCLFSQQYIHVLALRCSYKYWLGMWKFLLDIYFYNQMPDGHVNLNAWYQACM